MIAKGMRCLTYTDARRQLVRLHVGSLHHNDCTDTSHSQRSKDTVPAAKTGNNYESARCQPMLQVFEAQKQTRKEPSQHSIPFVGFCGPPGGQT